MSNLGHIFREKKVRLMGREIRHVSMSLLRLLQSISQGPRLTLWLFRNICCYGEELLTTRPTPKLEDQPLSAVRDCLFNIFAATLHIGGRSSIRNLRTRHAVVTGTHLSRPAGVNFVIKSSKASEQTHARHEPSTGNLPDVFNKTGQWSSNNKYLRNSYD